MLDWTSLKSILSSYSSPEISFSTADDSVSLAGLGGGGSGDPRPLPWTSAMSGTSPPM